MHPLDGPRLKLRRAESEIRRLRQTEESFQLEADYKLVKAELNSKTGNYAYRVTIGRQPEVEWGVYIGEIAHNLRSALDGLVYQLVLLNGGVPTFSTQFPIFRIGRTKKRRGASKRLIPHFEAGGRRMLHGVSKKHQLIIEKLQPCRRNRRCSIYGSGRDSALYVLGELNNADKHRLLQVVGGKPGPSNAHNFGIATSSAFLTANFNLVEVTGSHFVILKEGAKLLEAPPGVRVNANIVPLVAFSVGCDAVRNRGVVYTLARISKVVDLIIGQFSTDF